MCLANEKSKAGLYTARGARPGGAGGGAAEARSRDPLGGAVSAGRAQAGLPQARPDAAGWVTPPAEAARGRGGGRGSSLVQFIFPDSLCNHSPRAAPRAGCLLFPPGLQLRSSPWTPGTRATKAALRPSEREGLATSPSHRPNSVPRARSQLYSHPRADKRGFKSPLLGCPVCFHARHRL